MESVKRRKVGKPFTSTASGAVLAASPPVVASPVLQKRATISHLGAKRATLDYDNLHEKLDAELIKTEARKTRRAVAKAMANADSPVSQNKVATDSALIEKSQADEEIPDNHSLGVGDGSC